MRKNLINLRQKKLGLDQTEFAKLIGISQPHLSKIESGATMPRMKTVRLIAEAAGETVSKIMDMIA